MIRDFGNDLYVLAGIWEQSDKISFAQWILRNLLSFPVRVDLEKYLKDPDK